MRAGRTLFALIVLFLGVLALLVLRYDPWVYTGMLDHPIVMTLLVGTATLLLALDMTHRVQDPKRAVVFKEGRFHQLDPRGEILVWPGTDIGVEVSLAEQRVLGWPVLVFDREGKEHTFIFALTWRIVPTGPRPGPREQRMLLMPNGERRTIVVQTVERAMREVARLCTPAQLRELAVDARVLEALRDRVNADLAPDALVVDRLHVVRLMLTDSKKDEPRAFRETRTVTQTRDWQGQLEGHAQADAHLPLALPPAPAPSSPPAQGGSAPRLAGPVVESSGTTLDGERAQAGQPGTTLHLEGAGQGSATVHEELTRTEDRVRGQYKDAAKKDAPTDAPSPLLAVADHAAILSAIRHNAAAVRQHLVSRGDHSGLAVLDAAMDALPASDVQRARIALVSFIARAVRQAYPQVPPGVTTTVEALMAGLTVEDPVAAASALRQKADTYRTQGDAVLSDALALASEIAAAGAASIFKVDRQSPGERASTPVAEQVLHASIDGALTGFLLGTLLSAVATRSPQLAGVLIPPRGALSPKDAGIARAIEQAAEEIV